jgi:hypothetical protein
MWILMLEVNYKKQLIRSRQIILGGEVAEYRMMDPKFK